MHSGLGCAVACPIKQVCSFQNVAVTNDAAIHDLVQMYLHVVGSLSSRWTSGCGVAGRKAGAQAVTNKYQWHPPPHKWTRAPISPQPHLEDILSCFQIFASLAGEKWYLRRV